MLLDTPITRRFEQQQAQLAEQKRQLAENLAASANTVFVIGPKEEQPVRLLPVYTQMAQQQQTGAIIPMGDNARRAFQQDQIARQKEMLEAARTNGVTTQPDIQRFDLAAE